MVVKKFTDFRGTIAKEEWNDAWDLVKTNITSVDNTYTADIDDGVLLCDGTFTVTLPTAVGIAGKIFYIKNIGTGTVTVEGDGSETIDGETTQDLDEQYDEMPVVSDGANWSIL